MKGMKRWLYTTCLVGGLVLGFDACTPSVPIPPPEPEKVSFALDLTAGVASFQYEASASASNAIVYVFNRDIGEGIITTAENDGSVGPTDPFPARVGDNIVITFETEDQLSSTCVKMADGQSSSASECSL